MPLSMANTGEAFQIRKIGGKQETRQFLAQLGFVAGGYITVISDSNGSMVISVKDSRVAIGRDLANKIIVSFIKEEGKNENT